MAKATWNHRVVRRYKDDVPEHMRKFCNKDCSWLEITEVHYKDGKPWAFAVDMKTVSAGGDVDDTDESALDDLHETLERMMAALNKPILDEKADFPEEVDG